MTRGITRLLIVALTFSPLALPLRPVVAADKAGQKPKAVIPVFSLEGPIVEKPVVDDFLFGSTGAVPLLDLVARLKKARDDDAVKAVVLMADSTLVGRAQTEEIRRVMDELKAAGKPIHVHTDWLSMGRYVLLSGASKISVSPAGDIRITGMYGESPYLRGLFDKIGIQPDALTCGDYKSAAEIFMRTGPSPEAERMLNWLLDSMFESAVDLIAAGRRVSPEKVRAWIDRGWYSAEAAQKAGIIDAVEHRQDFVAGLKERYGDDVAFDKRYGRKKGTAIDFSSPFAMFKIFGEMFQPKTPKGKRKDAVAIVYVEGPILPGQATPSPFMFGASIAYSTPIRKALDEVAADDSVKAVVLRVNSPGGSVVASEVILDATRRVKAKKPFVVSMGDVAGSGGYYVACGADTIFADPSTITGSIGVVATKLATTGMWDKVGIQWHVTKRGANAGILGSADVFSKKERETLQGWMDEVYEVFKGHVEAIRRDRLTKPIDEIAGGRVYTGKQALALGLIDKLGGLDDAIAQVAAQAGLEDYDVRVVPRPKNIMELLMGDLTGQGDKDDTISLTLPGPASSPGATLFDAALPYLHNVDPQRLRAIKAAFDRLALLQREGVSLSMPEILIRD